MSSLTATVDCNNTQVSSIRLMNSNDGKEVGMSRRQMIGAAIGVGIGGVVAAVGWLVSDLGIAVALTPVLIALMGVCGALLADKRRPR